MSQIKLYFSIPLTVLLTLGLVLGVLAGSGLAQKKVDLNAASEKELEAIKGVGPATANKIIANRPYKSVDDLEKAGMSDKRIKEIAPYVTVGAVPEAAAPTKAAPSAAPAVAPTKAAPAAPVSTEANAPEPKTKLAPGQ